jgi:hypothetical protein
MVKRKGFALALVLGLLLIALGVVLLIERVWDIPILSAWWPLVLVVFGAAFFVSLLTGPRGLAFLAVPGSVLLMLGLILFYQSWFSLWSTWTYAWTLLIFALGIGFWIFNIQMKQRWIRILSGILIGIGLLKYLCLGFIFEKLIHISNSITAATLAYVGVVILTGIWVILTPYFFGYYQHKSTLEVTPGE